MSTRIKGDIVQYICHSDNEDDYDYDVFRFKLGMLYKISGSTLWSYLIDYIEDDDTVGNVHEYQIEKVVYDNKLNRVLYPDYIEYKGYLIKEF
jgi:hypothetical protein